MSVQLKRRIYNRIETLDFPDLQAALLEVAAKRNYPWLRPLALTDASGCPLMSEQELQSAIPTASNIHTAKAIASDAIRLDRMKAQYARFGL